MKKPYNIPLSVSNASEDQYFNKCDYSINDPNCPHPSSLKLLGVPIKNVSKLLQNMCTILFNGVFLFQGIFRPWDIFSFLWEGYKCHEWHRIINGDPCLQRHTVWVTLNVTHTVWFKMTKAQFIWKIKTVDDLELWTSLFKKWLKYTFLGKICWPHISQEADPEFFWTNTNVDYT
mgnify:CR=1 FL=1